MKNRTSLLITALASILTCGAFAGSITIRELPIPADLPVIPWVLEGNENWYSCTPTFALHKEGVLVSTEGWIAIQGENLRIRIQVHKKTQINDKEGGEIWNGDFIRINLDAWGDGSGLAPKETESRFGPDDASIGFALSSRAGATGWVFDSNEPDLKRNSPYPKNLFQIERDEEKSTTTYDLRIPWKRIASAPGLTPQFGISVIVRNIDTPDQKQPVQLIWGGSDKAFIPGTFIQLTPGNPPSDIANVLAIRSELWSPALPLLAQANVASTNPQTLIVTAGTEKKSLDIPGSRERTPHYFQVEYRPEAGAENRALNVTIKPLKAKLVMTPILPGKVINDLVARIDELIRSSPHPLFSRHLESVKAVVQTEWARALTEVTSNITTASETYEFAGKILAGLRGPAGRWESYWRDGLPLTLAFTSKADGTLQRYLLDLPKGWNPELSREKQATYPLFVELHGKGHPSPLSAMAMLYTPAELNPEAKDPRTFASIQRAGYHLMPHGRGNLANQGIGETDVWEALANFSRTFRCDEDRKYLYGFSQGCGGTWRLATRTPDQWAAIALYAAGIAWIKPSPDEGGVNLHSTPVWMWTGENDRAIESHRVAAAKLKSLVTDLVAETSPGIGHQYISEVQEKSLNWMQQFKRKHPDHFTFVVDTDEHPGIWGIELKRDVNVNPLPWFDCRIEGGTIHIDSAGTSGLRVNPGTGGLGLTGEIIVIWNGLEAYRGPVKEIKLGK